MTPTINTTYVAEATGTAAAIEVAAAEQMLRDVAFVLRLTRRVKAEMMADHRAEANAAAGREAEGVLVA